MNNNIEELYKNGSNEASPNAVDKLILNAAKQSCKDRPVSKAPTRKWLYNLSTAAVLVMGISIVFNLKNQNSEIKTSPESVNYSTLKDDLRAKSASAPPLEPHPRPQKKRKKISNKNENQSGFSLGQVIAQKPGIHLEQDSNTTQKESISQLIVEKVIPIKSNIKTIEFEEIPADDISQIFETITVTGMRKSPRNSKRNSKTKPEFKRGDSRLKPEFAEIKKLESLILEKNTKQAQILLKQLQNTYPNYEWHEYINSISNLLK